MADGAGAIQRHSDANRWTQVRLCKPEMCGAAAATGVNDEFFTAYLLITVIIITITVRVFSACPLYTKPDRGALQ